MCYHNMSEYSMIEITRQIKEHHLKRLKRQWSQVELDVWLQLDCDKIVDPFDMFWLRR